MAILGAPLGPYVLLVPIGAGGMGEVWKARDTRLDRIVAVKRLKADFKPEVATSRAELLAKFDKGPSSDSAFGKG
jgi:serine/threonine protein kinase